MTAKAGRGEERRGQERREPASRGEEASQLAPLTAADCGAGPAEIWCRSLTPALDHGSAPEAAAIGTSIGGRTTAPPTRDSGDNTVFSHWFT